MPTVVVLALTLALAPAPSPSATSGPVGDLLGGVGRVVDDLLDGHRAPSATPTPGVTPTAMSAPTRPPATAPPSPTAPGVTAATAGSSAGVRAPAAPGSPAGGSGADAHDAAVPVHIVDTPTPEVPPALASPTRGGWPPVSYLLVAAVLAVLALLLPRRRASDSTIGPASDPGPAPSPDPEPDPDPGPDNVRRLPTSLNAIYELGRLDERLEQERRRT
ncbi:hypothetical protein [Micromonospora sp. NBC_00617]|uniref:hypothetical protein n=1 Tax=Micromonospora sp. NBC_00617 TaxID=2903587 RepID=UPI0030E3A52D